MSALRLHQPPAPEPVTAAADAAPPSATPAALLDVDGVAALLSLGSSTVWRHHAAGRIPAPIRIGRSVRWRRDELVEWIESGCPARAVWERMRGAR